MSFNAPALLLLAAHIAAPAPTASVPPAGGDERRTSSSVCVVLDFDARLPTAIQRLAVDEAARVWAPYGVNVTLRKGPLPVESPPVGAVLSVRLAGLAPRAMAASSPFGSIGFVSGLPKPLVFLHYDAISRAIAGSGALGLREGEWPTALRDRVLGRIVGRVLAHEIGHFVLRSPRHASRGLMRPIQYVAELISGNGELFGLTPEDLSLLRTAMTLSSTSVPLGGQ